MSIQARHRLLFTLCALTLLTSGCGSPTTDPRTRFVPGDGSVTVLPPAERQVAGPVSGTTLQGDHVDLADYRGTIVVVNAWAHWCGPCRGEAPDLAEAARRLRPEGVVFLGINTRDESADAARAFEKKHRPGYPSIADPGGRTLLAFRGALLPSALPSTLVVDAEGRVAAVVLGEIGSASTLVGLVHDVAEDEG
ncbi:TlpA disulfide reductase family protein [Marmoricola sp. RAF53]|uniref:TlpA disulfide reductase family protein n=1 Tax=Marmoricola sp. RAF53 TaxID=3233059 RepID=UPI003F965C2A